MESPIGLALMKVRTSNQWSLLDGMARKTGFQTAELHNFLEATDDETLRRAGVWKHKVGKCYIICTNPGYRQALQELGPGEEGCTCGVALAASDEEARGQQRYFGSMDYNAGRHALDSSSHKTTCPFWAPPTSGHLFSWRRGYEN